MTELSAALALTEIGVDMAILENAKHLSSWAGFESANNEIAGKNNSNRVAKPAQYLKPLLIQCALTAIKNKKEPYFAIKYQHIKKRRGNKKAVIAMVRIILVCICHMALEEKSSNPTDYIE
jgi:transposase